MNLGDHRSRLGGCHLDQYVILSHHVRFRFSCIFQFRCVFGLEREIEK